MEIVGNVERLADGRGHASMSAHLGVILVSTLVNCNRFTNTSGSLEYLFFKYYFSQDHVQNVRWWPRFLVIARQRRSSSLVTKKTTCLKWKNPVRINALESYLVGIAACR